MVSKNRYSPRYANILDKDNIWTGTNTFSGEVITSGGFAGTAALTTEEGSGMAGLASYSSTITKVGNNIYTTIDVDIQGIVSSATADDIIGDDGAANAHIGQIIVADCGYLLSGSMTCLEAPVGGDTDINLNAASIATGTEDVDVTGLTNYAVLLNSGVWTLGLAQALTALPTTAYYLYLSAGSGTAAAYTAGKFRIQLVGIASS